MVSKNEQVTADLAINYPSQLGIPDEDQAEPSSWPSLTFLGLTLPPLLFVSLLFSSLLLLLLLLLSVNDSSSDVSIDQKMCTLWTPSALAGILGSAWKEKHFPLRLKCFWPSAASTLKVPEFLWNQNYFLMNIKLKNFALFSSQTHIKPFFLTL